MECSKCKMTSPDNQKFCGNCGHQFVNDTGVDKAEIESLLKKVVEERYKEQELLEYKTTENIIKKIIEWSKTFAYIVGIPFTILLAVLSFFGYDSYSKFTTEIKAQRNNIDSIVEASKKNISTLANKTANLNANADSLKIELESYKQLSKEMKETSKSINDINDKINKDAKTTNVLLAQIKSDVQLNAQIAQISLVVFTTEISKSDISSGNFRIKGQILGNIPKGYKLYAMIKIWEQYSITSGSLLVSGNGNWSKQLVVGVPGSGSSADMYEVGILLCSESASTQIENQIKSKDWRVQELKPGMYIIGNFRIKAI